MVWLTQEQESCVGRCVGDSEATKAVLPSEAAFLQADGLKRDFPILPQSPPAYRESPNPPLLLGSSHAAPPFSLYLQFLFPRILVFCHAPLPPLVTFIKRLFYFPSLLRKSLAHPVPTFCCSDELL